MKTTPFSRFLIAAFLCLTASLFFTAFIPTDIASNAGEDRLEKTGIQSPAMRAAPDADDSRTDSRPGSRLHTGPVLTDKEKTHLRAAAEDPTLAPWQREFVQEMIGGRISRPSAVEKPRPAGELSESDGIWSELPPPRARYGHTAIYDPARTRMVVFGGADEGSACFNDVWTLSLWGDPHWAPFAASGTPPSERVGHTAIYDPVRGRMVVFGGLKLLGSHQNDVWALSLGASPEWTLITPSGTPPSGRNCHTAIYDPVRDRMVVFGGTADGVSQLDDVWALSLGASPEWTPLTPSGTPPSGRDVHTAIYDPARDRMVVFGGVGGTFLNDVWTLSLGASPEWTLLTPSGTPPSPRCFHTAIYDPVGDRMVVFGGDGATFALNDLWALSLGASPEWTLITPSGTPPSPRCFHTAIYDPFGDRMIVFGGYDDSSELNDVWTLSLGASPEWTELALSTRPSERNYHTAIYDPTDNRMVVFGGLGESSHLNDVWTLSLGASPEWTLLAPSGTPPSERFYHAAIYDPVGDRMIVFGGYDGSYRYDLWALSLGASPEWTELASSGGWPSGRYGHAAIYDPTDNRMVVFGGWNASSQLNDVWALSLGASPEWTLLAPSGTPPSEREGHTAIYDPTDNRMVVFGGYDGAGMRNDVWALSLGASPEWTLLTPSGTPPSERHLHTAIYDPTDDRMVVFGGHDGSYRYDVWALSLGASPEWTLLAPSGTPPSGRVGNPAIYDPTDNRMVVFGGWDGHFTNDVWGLQWATATGVTPPTETPSLENALHPCYPNPFNPEVTIPFELRQDERATLTIYDIRGSLIKTVFDGELPRGMHRKAWNGKNEKGEQVSSGVYFCRLRVGEFSATQKILMLK